MKKEISLVTGIFCLLNFAAVAGIVSIQDAQTVAVNYFKSQTQAKGVTGTLAFTKTEADGSVDFYVFNMSPQKGFVMVSGIDNAKPILAYSNESYFSSDINATNGISDWLDELSGKIANLSRNTIPADDNISKLWAAYRQGTAVEVAKTTSVSPLCATTWDQNNTSKGGPPPYLYNLYCPVNTVDNKRCFTGCVATAMAQIMKYWDYPVQGTGSYTYTPHKYNPDGTIQYTYPEQYANFGATTFSWADMPDVLTDASTTTQNEAISLLMYECGVSVNMGYGDAPPGSTADGCCLTPPSAASAFATYFGYNAASLTPIVPGSSASAWATQLKNELNAGRPFLYTGISTGGAGHCWVCDGYNSSDMFHMNWGWGGTDNGYYGLSSMDAVDEYDFVSGFGAMIGIEPATCQLSLPVTTTTAITTTGATFNWTAFAGTVSTNLRYRKVGTTTWKKAPAGSTNLGAYIATGLTPATEYEWQVQQVCTAGTTAYTRSTNFFTYCTASEGDNTYQYISKFQFGSIQNSSTGNDGGYTDYTNISTKVTAGSAYYITLTSGFKAPGDVVNCYYTVFIDYNHDGVFDSTEMVTKAMTVGTKAVKTPHFTVPAGAYVGSTRVRVVMETDGYQTNSCVSPSVFPDVTGDVQDYSVNILQDTLAYCKSYSENNVSTYIAKVQMYTIQNSSGGDNSGYTDFTNISTTLTTGSSYYITLTSGFDDRTDTPDCYYNVYIDFDHNGTFTGKHENVAQVKTVGFQPAQSASFTIPDYVYLGPTRMRIQMQPGEYATSSCATLLSGDVQDYTIVFASQISLLGEVSAGIPAGDNGLDVIQLYPNPAQDNITISLSTGNSSKGLLNVYNLQGQKLLNNQISTVEGNNIFNINTSNLSNGIYIVELAMTSNAQRLKFVVAR